MQVERLLPTTGTHVVPMTPDDCAKLEMYLFVAIFIAVLLVLQDTFDRITKNDTERRRPPSDGSHNGGEPT